MSIIGNDNRVSITDGKNRDKGLTVHNDGSMQVQFAPGNRSVYGDTTIAELWQRAGANFNYKINPAEINSWENGGTVSHSDSQAVVSTGAGANQKACIISTRPIHHTPGFGSVLRTDGLFTTGVANSTQLLGLGDHSNGFFFGYNGATFGVLHRNGGSPEVRTLTVTTASTTDEDITVQLNGNSIATITVTNSGNITTTVNEIAAGDYAAVGGGWDAFAKGNQVVFVSRESAVKTGTYNITASTAVGTFAQTIAGVAPTDTWTAQDSWNGDKFNGAGSSGVTLDPTKGNNYEIKFHWGYGTAEFFIQDPADSEYHLVHILTYGNANTSPSLSNTSSKYYACVENTSNTTDLVIKSTCFSLLSEGIPQFNGRRLGVLGTSASVGTTEIPIISVRSDEVFGSKVNRACSKIMRISVAMAHSAPIIVQVYANPTLTGASWAAVDSDISPVYVDTSATAVSGGRLVYSQPVAQTDTFDIDLSDDAFAGMFTTGNYFTVTADATSGSGGSIGVGINYVDII